MSKRRRPGEIVARKPGSAFLGAGQPRLVRLTDETDGGLHDIDLCVGLCDDPECQEWANVEIIVGPHKGGWMFHLSECMMEDLTAEDRRVLEAEELSKAVQETDRAKGAGRAK